MKKFITLCLVLGTTYAAADSVQSPIHSVEKIQNTYLIRFENGRVGISDVKPQGLPGDLVKVKLDNNQKVLSLKKLAGPSELASAPEALFPVEPAAYQPTLIASLADATAIFNRLNPNFRKDSECTNRAHVWSNEEFKKNNIKSLKVFLLLTGEYIIHNRFKWWFHVAPALTVQEGDKVETRMLDYTFSNRPKTIKEWTDQYVFSKRACKQITKISEHTVNDQSEDCFIMVESMYFWMPGDLEAREKTGYVKSDFYSTELRSAYAQAFLPN